MFSGRRLAFGLVCALTFNLASARARNPQTPDWSADDEQFFLHGSIGDEFAPEIVLAAFRATYPALFPGKDLTAFGLNADEKSDLPVGISRRKVPHLGNLSAIGINCASCHSAEIMPSSGGAGIRIDGVTGHFDAEAFFGSIVAATFQSGDPANMKKFLAAYFQAAHARGDDTTLRRRIEAQSGAIADAMKAEQANESRDATRLLEMDAGALDVARITLSNTTDLTPTVRALMRLFHNMRIGLHIPHRPPEKLPPASGPGRNNAFGSLTLALFGEQTVFAPAKYGVAWNTDQRKWVHWDGNTRSPIVRNLAAAIGLGAPLIEKRGLLDYAMVDRMTQLTEHIRPPKYPWKIDTERAQRGQMLFAANCASCHVQDRTNEDKRLYAVSEIKTDPNRAKLFGAHEAALFNLFFAELQLDGFKAEKEPVLRSTGKYVAIDLAGVWARSPFLHNGSVRTMRELLTPAAQRPSRFNRGSRVFDEKEMGYTDAGAFIFDCKSDGNSNAGHEYGVQLSDTQKRDLMEYLKTL